MDGSTLPVTRRQALAFRLARHHLAGRLGPGGAQSAAVVGLQDTPPGTAALALAARADVVPEALDELVLVPSVRGAPLAVAEEDLAVFTAGLEPPDEEAAKAVVGNAWKSLDGITAMEALGRVSEAVHDSLCHDPLPATTFTRRCASGCRASLCWCKGCGSHHVHPLAVARYRCSRRAGDRRARGAQRRLRPSPEGPAARGPRRPARSR